jgi:hypothetical protein
MVRDKHCDALLTLLVIKDKISSILNTIRDLKADEVKRAQPQLLLLFEKLVGNTKVQFMQLGAICMFPDLVRV